MNMIEPVRAERMSFCKEPGRPVGERTMEIAGELLLAKSLGRYTVTIPYAEGENGIRFASKARRAAKIAGVSVRVRKLEGRGELTLVDGCGGE